MNKLVFILAISIFSYADTCGGNCPLNDCPNDNCSCGYSQNIIDIAYYCSQFRGWSQSCCQCIASNISNGNTNTVSFNSNGYQEIGIWQINSTNWDLCNNGNPPCSPKSNLECAKLVWILGENSWKYWPSCLACGCCDSSEENEKLKLEIQARMKEMEEKARSYREHADKNRPYSDDSHV